VPVRGGAARLAERLEQRWRTVHRAHGELHVRTPRTRPHRGRVADGRGAAEPAAGEPVRQADRAEQRHLPRGLVLRLDEALVAYRADEPEALELVHAEGRHAARRRLAQGARNLPQRGVAHRKRLPAGGRGPACLELHPPEAQRRHDTQPAGLLAKLAARRQVEARHRAERRERGRRFVLRGKYGLDGALGSFFVWGAGQPAAAAQVVEEGPPATKQGGDRDLVVCVQLRVGER